MDNADDNICEPDEENKECQKAILNAKSAAQRLAKKEFHNMYMLTETDMLMQVIIKLLLKLKELLEML